MLEGGVGFRVESGDRGSTLTLTGRWTGEATGLLRAGRISHLRLNYTQGFSEPSLDFIEDWPLQELSVLDRHLRSIVGAERLGPTLRRLSIEAAPAARIDLGKLPRLRYLFGEWKLIRPSVGALHALKRLSVLNYGAETLSDLAGHGGLETLVLAGCRKLQSMEGLGALSRLRRLEIALAPHLSDISAIASVSATLEDLRFETCRSIGDIASVGALSNLHTLGIANCGSIASFAPLRTLTRLERLFAWESTRVLDGDLSSLVELPALEEVRMQSRRDYRPSVEAVRQAIEARST